MEPLALRMRTRDETGSGRGNLTKFAFSKFLKFFQNFLKFPEKFLLFLAQNIFQIETFLAAWAGLGPGGPKTCLFPVFGAYGFLPGGILGGSGFWPTGCNRAQPPATAHRTVTSCRRFEIWRSVFPI